MTILNTEQARSIREADSVCFDTDRDGARIRAIRRGTGDASGEITTTIPLGDSYRINKYDGAGECHAFAMILSAQFVPEWRTACRRIKSGSEISLHWIRGNASPVTEQAGLAVDYLNIIVNGEAYRVENYVGLDNSARMVRTY